MNIIRFSATIITVALHTTVASANNDHMRGINHGWDQTYLLLLREVQDANSVSSKIHWLSIFIKDAEAYADKAIREIGTVTDAGIAFTTLVVLLNIEADLETLLRSSEVPESSKTEIRRVLILISAAKETVAKRWEALVEKAGKDIENAKLGTPKPSPIIEQVFGK